MNLSLESKITLGFGAAWFVLVLVSATTWWNVARFKGTHLWVEHSRDVLSNLESAQTDLLSMQTSARGFVLTGNDEVLRPFDTSAAHLDSALRSVQRLTADDDQQQKRLTQLQPIADEARRLMRERIADRRARGMDAATETATYVLGQRTVDSFRSQVREMTEHERRLLDRRLEHNIRVGNVTMGTIVAACAISLVLVAVAGRRVHHELKRRREAEAALQASFARVEDLYNRAPCGYHSLDPSGAIVAINDTALAWLGYTRDEVIGRMKFTDLLTPASAALFAGRFEHFIRVGAVENVEYQWRRKEGSTLPVLLNATAIYDATGRYVASRATVFDVTRRKHAEEERDRFFTLSHDLLCIATLDGRFKRLNPAWEATLGFTNDELLAHNPMEWVHPDDIERSRSTLARLAGGHDAVSFENRFRGQDGSYRWFSWNARPVVGEGLIFASARDITESKAAEARIQKLNHDLGQHAQKLETANLELESFSYSVSHDLRAPLRHIDGFAALLAKHSGAAIDAEGHRYLTVISKAARQMGALIDDLLAFSRISRAPLRQEHVNQDQLVASVIADGRFDTPERAITWQIGPLPIVAADSSMLRQVWTNFIDNAVKYSGKTAAPHITIEGHEDSAAGEYVFSVRDNGVGFDMAYADKLFGVFQRLHGATEFEGTGIGLANVRRIVTRHSGRTWAESRSGEGATFYFSLPRHPAPSPPAG